jgi:hypothetical protein
VKIHSLIWFGVLLFLILITILAALIYYFLPGQWGFIDKKGDFAIKPELEDVSKLFLEQPQWPALVKREGKWQYIDRSGKRVIDHLFGHYTGGEIAPGKDLTSKGDFAFEFKDGIAYVFIGGKKGIIDTSGKVTYPRISDLLPHWARYSDGLAPFRNKDGRWGYLDRQGLVVIPAQFSFAYDFSEGLACVQTAEGCGYIDKAGVFVIKPVFDSAENFSEGLAPVCQKECWGYIDKSGKLVLKPQYSAASPFSEGLAYVEIREESADKSGRSILKWAYIDKSGRVVIGPRSGDGGWEISTWYPSCTEFSEGLAAQRENGKFGYIDRTGRWVIPPRFYRPGRFSNGLAGVQVAH